MLIRTALLCSLAAIGCHRGAVSSPPPTSAQRLVLQCLRVEAQTAGQVSAADSVLPQMQFLDSARAINPRAPGGMRMTRNSPLESASILSGYWAVVGDTLFIGNNLGLNGYEYRLAVSADTMRGYASGWSDYATAEQRAAGPQRIWAVRTTCDRAGAA